MTRAMAVEATASTPLSTPATPGRSVPLSPKLLEDAVHRLPILAVFFIVDTAVVHVLQRFGQPQLAAVMDDPINRLTTLAAVLMAGGLIALERFKLVPARTLLGLGMVFEVVVAFSISMFETFIPFDADIPRWPRPPPGRSPTRSTRRGWTSSPSRGSRPRYGPGSTTS
jgi:hypothetical protein